MTDPGGPLRKLAALLAGIAACVAVSSATASPGRAQAPGPVSALVEAGAENVVVLRGGWLFDGLGDGRVPNTGLVVAGGKIMAVGADLSGDDTSGARVIELEDDATVLPGIFDLHAHHGMNLFGTGRVDETRYNPLIFLANGVTSVFPAGEMDPDRVAGLQSAIRSGGIPGPRLMRSGPYFGTARPGWNPGWTAADVRDEVNRLAAEGVAGFKAKGISPEHLRALVERAHFHGLPVTGHLGSGHRGSVNPRDAILMGIDRIEHFMGGDAMPDSRSAYASLVDIRPDTPEFERIARLFIDHGVYFDATMTAYGYYGERDARVFGYWVDEREFFTPFARERFAARDERRVSEQFERIYWIKRDLLRAFYEAGGGPLITLGTDHPSDGDYLSGFAAHRELHAFVLSGIPEADALRMATINGARAMGRGNDLGTFEAGKLADLFVVGGDPLEEITATRNVRLVMKAGHLHDPAELLEAARGRIGPSGPEEMDAWGRR